MKNWLWLISLYLAANGCGTGPRSAPATQSADTTKGTPAGAVSSSGPSVGRMNPDTVDSGQAHVDTVRPAPHIIPSHGSPDQRAIDSIKLEKFRSKSKK